MKDLRSKEHYDYKIHTLLMASSAPPIYRQTPSYMDYSHPFLHPPSIDNPLYGLPPFLQIILDPPPPFYDFSKISTPYI